MGKEISRGQDARLAALYEISKLVVGTTDADRTTLDVIFRQTQLARPLAAPPGTPPARVAALRKAMLDTLRDPALVADAKRIRIEFNPVPGAEAASIFAGYYNTPPAIVKKAMALIGRK